MSPTTAQDYDELVKIVFVKFNSRVPFLPHTSQRKVVYLKEIAGN
jgi:hypothetical protein